MVAVLLASGLWSLQAQTPAPRSLGSTPVDAATRVQLEAARDTVWRAWFSGDVARLSRVIPTALAAGSPRGWDDRAATIAGSRDFVKHGGRLVSISFDSTAITLRGPVAIVQSRYTYVLEERGSKRTTVRGLATEVFVREHGRWTNPFWYLDG